MPLRGLIFDFDGLIVDTETATLAAWRQIHREDGLTGDPSVLHAIVGHTDIKADIWVAYPPAQDREPLKQRFFDRTRLHCREAPVLPGVLALLDAAREAGIPLAVTSNSSRAHVEGHLDTRGLLARFAAIACREDVPRGKPAPDVYLAALEKLGLPAAAVIAFEDSLPGHEAAAAADLRVVVVPNPSTQGDTFRRASLRVASMTEISLARLKQLRLP